MPRPRGHTDATRDALRDAAERLFDEGGPDAVSVRSVAAAVGTTTRAVYTLFGSKDGLMVNSLAARAYAFLEEGLDRQPETDDPAADLIECGVVVYGALVREHPALFRIAFQRAVPITSPGPELIEARTTSMARLAAKVNRLKQAGQLRGRSVEQALLEFEALCEGLANLELRGTVLALLPDRDVNDVRRAAFKTLVRGFARTPDAPRH